MDPKKASEQFALTLQSNFEQLAETWTSSWSSRSVSTNLETLKALQQENTLLRTEEQAAAAAKIEQTAAAASIVAAQMIVAQDNMHLREQVAHHKDVAAKTALSRLPQAASGQAAKMCPPPTLSTGRTVKDA